MALIPIDKLTELEKKYEQLQADMANPEIIADQAQYRKTTKTISEIEDVVRVFRQWRDLQSRFDQAKGMLSDSDPDMVEMANAEIAEVEGQLPAVAEELQFLMLPKDPNDAK